MSPLPPRRAAFIALLLVPSARLAAADPFGLQIDGSAEYRVDSTLIDPFELGGDTVTRAMWTDQRLRTDWRVKHEGTVELHVQADLLAGVLFGDTGTYGVDQSTNSGVSIARPTVAIARQPRLSARRE